MTVAVGPGVFAGRVDLVAVGVGVADDIEPALRPTFPVARARERFIDEGFPRERIGRGLERLNLSGSGREAVQVQVKATDERAAIGAGRLF